MTTMNDDPFACFGEDSSDSEDDNGPMGMTHLVTDDSSFEIFDAGPCSGKGLRATAAFARGDEIIRESAAMRAPNHWPASSAAAAEVLHHNAIQRAYNALHPTTQASFMALSSCNEGGPDGSERTPRGVYDTNSFRLGESRGGLFLTVARLNHSCRPNVNHCWRVDLQQTLVFAIRDIRIGEELCTTYGPSECMDTAGRRGYLHDRFSFRCGCDMCREGNVHGGDDRMSDIRTLQEDLALSAGLASGNARAALDSVKKCLALMEEQGIGGGVFTKAISHQGYDICRANGDEHGARGYLREELLAVKDSEGADCAKALQIECALSHMHNS